jgi:hypothetical protein
MNSPYTPSPNDANEEMTFVILRGGGMESFRDIEPLVAKLHERGIKTKVIDTTSLSLDGIQAALESVDTEEAVLYISAHGTNVKEAVVQEENIFGSEPIDLTGSDLSDLLGSLNNNEHIEHLLQLMFKPKLTADGVSAVNLKTEDLLNVIPAKYGSVLIESCYGSSLFPDMDQLAPGTKVFAFSDEREPTGVLNILASIEKMEVSSHSFFSGDALWLAAMAHFSAEYDSKANSFALELSSLMGRGVPRVGVAGVGVFDFEKLVEAVQHIPLSEAFIDGLTNELQSQGVTVRLAGTALHFEAVTPDTVRQVITDLQTGKPIDLQHQELAMAVLYRVAQEEGCVSLSTSERAAFCADVTITPEAFQAKMDAALLPLNLLTLGNVEEASQAKPAAPSNPHAATGRDSGKQRREPSP